MKKALITGGAGFIAAYTDNAGGTNFSATRIDLKDVRDLGTSVLSGDGAAGSDNPGFPAGPDILKTNIQPILNPIDKIFQINGVTFN
jgi:hypothetical protein